MVSTELRPLPAYERVFDNITLRAQGARHPGGRARRGRRQASGCSTTCSTVCPNSSPAASASVAMGRAIVREPSVFFDEPLSNLDANLRNQMRIELRRHRTSVWRPPASTTHDQVEAMTLAEKIPCSAGNIECTARRTTSTASGLYSWPSSWAPRP